ncbi:folate family ECF transporter S component [Weissella diestrammenae]|uniref:Folate family ECF transporter S component n=1 Tax=Weissella diestrammenae TaxID=1162633 RepID=A0A7G9T473_9LACO|nr:folate family ECF transporter S component [Weissella diestrammenae]MCM0583424.1 folate family ECF transporter S component [Weissella diestrammenae]QNN74898.1 folate family ECF transporter S component [Weissella diestrammenae]
MKTLALKLPPLRIQGIALLGILMALELVISRFSIGSAFLKISFTFIIIGMIAKWFGPWWGLPVAFIMDFLTNLMSGQPYIFPFALIALLNAFIFGWSYYNRIHLSWSRLIITIFIQLLLSNVILNTTLLSLYHFIPIHSLTEAINSPIVWTRIAKNAIMWPIEVIISYAILNNKNLEQLRQRIF